MVDFFCIYKNPIYQLNRIALRKDTALALTGSQPLGWEPILGGSASSSLTRGRASFKYIPSLEAGNEVTQEFRLFLVPFALGLCWAARSPTSSKSRGSEHH
ncbi:hypothetical protein [Nostoc sp.]|uniref:hypothetical protein n=1 Tax=Nostoc sp. TaxID=1180 RepID=UPI002FF465DF